ncbi:MAG: hypothetical protein ABIT04_12055 [Novosphingobium sp.]
MSRLARQLQSDRAARDDARAELDSRLAQVREDLHARGIGGRIADRIVADATDIALEAADVAQANKGVIAGTIAVLILWFFRHPIIARVEKLLGMAEDEPSRVDELLARLGDVFRADAEKE